MSNKDPYLFFEKIRDAKKILVLDLGFLGDSIHLIPALNCIRQAMPDVELHVMIAEHVTGVLELTPWVDQVWGYPRFPKGPKWYQDFGRISLLRKEKYDAVINLNGSDRSSILTVTSGVSNRLGRVPERVHPMWDRCFTHVVNVEYGQSSVFEQRCKCLVSSGFPECDVAFNLVVSADVKESVQNFVPTSRYIHVSPFTPVDAREIPYKQLAGLLHDLSDRYPEDTIVMTCSPNDREREKMDQLIRQLHFEKWEVVQERLSIAQLGAIIDGADLHLGADTGTLHLALALGKKTVSWFHENKLNQIHWRPKGEGHRSVIGELSDLGLIGISNGEIIDAVGELMQV